MTISSPRNWCRLIRFGENKGGCGDGFAPEEEKRREGSFFARVMISNAQLYFKDLFDVLQCRCVGVFFFFQGSGVGAFLAS